MPSPTWENTKYPYLQAAELFNKFWFYVGKEILKDSDAPDFMEAATILPYILFGGQYGEIG